MKITINDVAKKAGVSKATVSRILNGRFEHAKPETKQRILDVIKELDYSPNPLARGLKQLKTNTIGIVLSNMKNPFWTSVLEGVEDSCRKLGYSLMISNSSEDPALEEGHVRNYQNRQVDGVIINPTVKNEAIFEQLIESGYPFVLVNRKIAELNDKVNMVVMNNVKGAYLAVEHLIKLGKRRIAVFVYAAEGISTWQERVEGYRQALKQHGFGEDDAIIVQVRDKPNEVKQATLRLLAGAGRPDAIFSTNNMMTLQILEGVHEAGLRVPEDIALVGYDETAWSKYLSPPLTTVYQPAFEMGILAAKVLIKTIEKKSKKRKTFVLEPELIVRSSCGNPEHSFQSSK